MVSFVFIELQLILLDENIIKVIGILEIFEAIIWCFAEDSLVDHVDDDIAEVYRFPNPPVVENHLGHGPITLKGEIFNALEKLLAGHMSWGSELLARILQTFEYEYVSIEGVALIRMCDLA